MSTGTTELCNRAKQDFIEMPGLMLTARQASRLWNIERTVCEEVLASLVSEAFLLRTADGTFLRRHGGPSIRGFWVRAMNS